VTFALPYKRKKKKFIFSKDEMELCKTAAGSGTIMERMRLQNFISEAEMELVKMAAGPGTIMEGM
jgi:hypothetical protein